MSSCQLIYRYPEIISLIVLDPIGGAKLAQEKDHLKEHSNYFRNNSDYPAKIDTFMLQLLKIHKCVNHLLQSHEFHRNQDYDAVVRSRPDIILHEPLLISNILDGDTIHFPGYKQDVLPMFFSWESRPLGLPDNIYLGSGKVMKLISISIFYFIQNLPKMGENLYPEHMLYLIFTEIFGLSFKGKGIEKVGLYRVCGDQQCVQQHENRWFEVVLRK